MSTRVIATRPADARIDGYRRAERSLWQYYGLAPSERFVELERLKVRLRVLDIGFGEPILFVHGVSLICLSPRMMPLLFEFVGPPSMRLGRGNRAAEICGASLHAYVFPCSPAAATFQR